MQRIERSMATDLFWILRADAQQTGFTINAEQRRACVPSIEFTRTKIIDIRFRLTREEHLLGALKTGEL